MVTTAAVILDVEGTLMDCVPQVLESWSQVLGEYGHPFRPVELHPYSGMDGNAMLCQLLPTVSEDTRQELLKRQGKSYRERYLESARPFPRVQETLQELLNAGVLVGIATTCKHDELATYDKTMRAKSLASAIVCGDDVARGKPHPDLFQAMLERLHLPASSRVVAFGDTPYDAQAAAAVGIEAVGVISGGFSKEELQSAGCRHVLESIQDLGRWIGSRV